MRATFVLGDIHGHREKLIGLLRAAALIGQDHAWTGADSALWLLGDLTDRGPDGVGVIELVMRLQREAAAAGGEVHALLGNHDLLIVAASPFATVSSAAVREFFRANWELNGGRERDLERLTPAHARCLASLPAMALVEDHLLVHADARSYMAYGRSVTAVNRAATGVLRRDDPDQWARLLDSLSQRFAFADPVTGPGQADAFLRHFGGRHILHGHTPIPLVTGQPAADVRQPLEYAAGRCLNLDGGMFLGGPGFVYRLPLLA